MTATEFPNTTRFINDLERQNRKNTLGVVMTEEELVAAIEKQFGEHEATWMLHERRDEQASVIFYMSAIVLFGNKPFNNPTVQEKVMEFLNKKLEEAQEKYLQYPLQQFKIMIQELEEV